MLIHSRTLYSSLHYITLCYTTLHCTALHCTTLHYTALYYPDCTAVELKKACPMSHHVLTARAAMVDREYRGLATHIPGFADAGMCVCVCVCISICTSG
jgi:hypothetical protein